MSSDAAPTLDTEGDTATITLRRPSQHNRIDPGAYQASLRSPETQRRLADLDQAAFAKRMPCGAKIA